MPTDLRQMDRQAVCRLIVARLNAYHSSRYSKEWNAASLELAVISLPRALFDHLCIYRSFTLPMIIARNVVRTKLILLLTRLDGMCLTIEKLRGKEFCGA